MRLMGRSAAARGAGAAAGESPDGLDGSDAGAPEHEPRDLKKLFLVAGLGALSWVATYVGMLELIEANMGELPLVHKVIIGFSVAMLMVMIVWLLDQMFAPIGWFTRLCYASGYIFLTLISVGFGFGFYWKVLESRSEATRGAESAIGQVQGSLFAASTRLEQLQGTLDTLTGISKQKATQETATGTSCPNSRPGDGPRRKLREDDAARFTFASDFVKGRVGQVKTDLAGLDADFARIAADDKSLIDARTGTRNEFMRNLGRRLDNTVTGFNAFRTDPQLKQIRQDLAERADRTTFPDSKGGTFQCPDNQLQAALKGVVRAIDELPALDKPKIAAVEGSEATIEAFRRLTATFYGALSMKLPPSADELRDLQKKAVQSVEQPAASARAASAEQPGLSKRDYIPLAIAIFVDLCLLLVSMGRPVNRMHGLLPRMREAERGPVYQILSRFNDIHKDEETRAKFEIFRHVVFDHAGDYYVAVPLDAPYNHRPKGAHASNERYTKQIEDLRLEASMLSNLFASFEKERIFTRVYLPTLGTKGIQKKLWRQGSKFAGSEAFRIYKFKDGAWSEIILGAVMGAARRVEADKRRRRLEDRIVEGLELPTPGLPAAAGELPRRMPREGLSTREHGHGLPGLGRSPAGREDPSAADTRPLAPDHVARYGAYAAYVRPEDQQQRPSHLSALDPHDPVRRPLDAIREAARRPRAADFEADVAVAPANNNTAPQGGHARPALPPANVIPLPSVRTTPPPRLPEPQQQLGDAAAPRQPSAPVMAASPLAVASETWIAPAPAVAPLAPAPEPAVSPSLGVASQAAPAAADRAPPSEADIIAAIARLGEALGETAAPVGPIELAFIGVADAPTSAETDEPAVTADDIGRVAQRFAHSANST